MDEEAVEGLYIEEVIMKNRFKYITFSILLSFASLPVVGGFNFLPKRAQFYANNIAYQIATGKDLLYRPSVGGFGNVLPRQRFFTNNIAHQVTRGKDPLYLPHEPIPLNEQERIKKLLRQLDPKLDGITVVDWYTQSPLPFYDKQVSIGAAITTGYIPLYGKVRKIGTGVRFWQLTEKEQLAALSHELGHDYLDHINQCKPFLNEQNKRPLGSYQYANLCRQQELEADNYAILAGHGNGLIAYLERAKKLAGPSASAPLLNDRFRTHPSYDVRIANAKRILMEAHQVD
jgi:hypothetical protein